MQIHMSLPLFACFMQYAADLITLFNNDTTVCGRGAVGFSGSYQEWPLVANANAWGYSLVMSGCWRGPALAHEIGHNMVSRLLQ